MIPIVSIGLPVYNGEKYLRQCVDSILSQTFENCELIICDNASSDKTEEICRKYAYQDPRVRYFRNAENLGAARNFNRTFELSCGEYFKWIAADEVIEPQFLEKCVDLLDRNPSVILSCTKYILINEIDKTSTNADYDHNLRSSQAYKRFRQFVGEPIGAEHPIWGVIRSKILKQTSLVRPLIGCDFCLIAALVLKGEFGQVPEYLNRLRMHMDAYSTKLRGENAELDGMQGRRESQWLDPENRGRVFLPHWRLLWEYFQLVIRSKEKVVAKCIMVGSLFYPLGVRWRTILTKELFFAAGIGNVYVKIKSIIRQRAVQG